MITIQQAVGEFLLSCEADGLSVRSLEYYQYALWPIARQLHGFPIDEIQSGPIRLYLAELRTKDRYENAKQRPRQTGAVSVETIRSRIRALRRFFHWCVEEYHLDPLSNPMLHIRMPRAPKQLPKAIDPADIRRLFEACGNDMRGIRDRAILAFLADTGCRAGGILGLQISDLDLDRGRAILREKGDRTRVVPFSPFTASLLRAWLEIKPRKPDFVFLSFRHQSMFEPMTVSGLNQVIKRLKQKAGVKGRCNPHSFRHGFAREYLKNGGDLATLAQLLGHSNVSITAQFYAVFSTDELARLHGQYGPLRDMGGERND
jgi:site-specific recombinase XerD